MGILGNRIAAKRRVRASDVVIELPEDCCGITEAIEPTTPDKSYDPSDERVRMWNRFALRSQSDKRLTTLYLWLSEAFCSQRWQDHPFKVLHVSELKQDGDTLFVRFNIYSETRVYHIQANLRPPDKYDDYLGATYTTRKDDPGEDWNRGADLADGEFSRDTFNKIVGDFLSLEALPHLDTDIYPELTFSPVMKAGDVEYVGIVPLIEKTKNGITEILAKKSGVSKFLDQDSIRDYYKKSIIRRFGDDTMPPEGTPEWDKWYELMGVKDWYQIGVSQGDCTPERAAEAIEQARQRIYGPEAAQQFIDDLKGRLGQTAKLLPDDAKHVNGKELKHGLTRDGKRYGVSIAKDKDGYFCYTHRARSKSYPTIADIPKSALKFIDSTGMKKVEGKAEVYLGESGLDQTWQNEFPANAKCHRCGGNARVAFVMKENDPDIAAIHDFNHEGADGGPLWLHDAGSFATYLCGKCLEPTTLYNQAMKAEAKKDTVASALEFLMSMPLYERDRNEGATVAEEIASSKHGLGPESHRIYDALCLLFVDKNAGLMFGDMPISDALDKLKEMGYDGVTRRKTEGHEPVTAAKSKTLHIWDFDGTLIDTGEFHQDRIDNPKPIKKNLDRFKSQIADDADVVVMTARSNAGLVRRTLEDAGVNMTGIRIIALGTTANDAKGEYIARNFASKYDTITLYDDRKAYLEAAEKAMEDREATFKTVRAENEMNRQHHYEVEARGFDTRGSLDAAFRGIQVYNSGMSREVVVAPENGKPIKIDFDGDGFMKFWCDTADYEDGSTSIVHVYCNDAAQKSVEELLKALSKHNRLQLTIPDTDWTEIGDTGTFNGDEPVVTGWKEVEMTDIDRKKVEAAIVKKYQITYADGTCAFRDMTPNHAESMRDRDGVAAVALMDLPDKKVEAGNKNKGEYDLWGSIEKAVERGLLAYVGFMAADYLHQKKNASFGLENYRPVIDAYGEIGHSDKLTDEDKSVILKRLNDAGWDASDEGIEFLWDEILRHRQIAS